MSQWGKRRCGTGVPGKNCAYETTYDDGKIDDPKWLLLNPYSIAPSLTYWETKESKQILRFGELCTIIAHELPPDEWYAERGLLEYHLGIEWDYDEYDYDTPEKGKLCSNQTS